MPKDTVLNSIKQLIEVTFGACHVPFSLLVVSWLFRKTERVYLAGNINGYQFLLYSSPCMDRDLHVCEGLNSDFLHSIQNPCSL